MKNIAKTIKDFITSQYPTLSIFNDMFPEDNTEGIIIVHDPSARKVAEFIDGTAIFNLNISFTIRDSNPAKGREVLDGILKQIDKKIITDSADGLKLKINVVSNVQFIGTDEKNRAIYTSSVSVEYKTF